MSPCTIPRTMAWRIDNRWFPGRRRDARCYRRSPGTGRAASSGGTSANDTTVCACASARSCASSESTSRVTPVASCDPYRPRRRCRWRARARLPRPRRCCRCRRRWCRSSRARRPRHRREGAARCSPRRGSRACLRARSRRDRCDGVVRGCGSRRTRPAARVPPPRVLAPCRDRRRHRRGAANGARGDREVVTLQHRPGREVTGCHERVLLGPEPRGAPVQRGEVGRDDDSGDDGDDERAGPERQGTR